MKFPYKQYLVQARDPENSVLEVFRPEVPVRIGGPLGELFLLGLVDTGADEVVIPKSIADAVGVFPKNDQRWEVCGIASQAIDVFVGDFELEIQDGDVRIRRQISAAVAHYPDTADEQVLILGHRGFLEYLNVELRGGEHVTIVHPVDPTTIEHL